MSKTKPTAPMVNICVIKEQHRNSCFQKNDVHLLYKFDGFYSNVESLNHNVGAAKIIMSDQVEEL